MSGAEPHAVPDHRAGAPASAATAPVAATVSPPAAVRP